MTDAEVMSIDEAIEHCYEAANRICDDCGKEHLQLAKWLGELKEYRGIINRLKAQNKEFDEKIVMQRGLIDTQKAEIERLSVELEFKCDSCKNIRLSREEYRKAILQSKSEAYREFAEKLCQKAQSTSFWSEHVYVNEEDIDNTLKELTGGE